MTSRRTAVLACPFLLAAVTLGACGGSDEASPSASTIDLGEGSTAFQTVPPATTTTTIAGEVGVVLGEQQYEVQSGDYGLKIADLFGISLADLEAYNGWADASKEFPGPGSIIKIPPGANDLSVAQVDTGGAEVATVTGGDDSGATTGAEPEAESGTPIPEAGDNCQAGSYTIEEGDFEGRVATKFDVTVEALRAANASTPDYDVFYVGLQIVIPAKDDC